MNMHSLRINPDFINNIKTSTLYSGYVLLAYIMIHFLNFLKNSIPDILFYMLFSYLSVRTYEVMNNENLTKISDKLDSMLFTCSYDFIILFSKGQIIVGKISSNITKLAILLGDKYIESRLECYIYPFFNI